MPFEASLKAGNVPSSVPAGAAMPHDRLLLVRFDPSSL